MHAFAVAAVAVGDYMFPISWVPLALLKATPGIQTNPLMLILLELLVRQSTIKTPQVLQVLHFLTILTQSSRCSRMLAIAPLPSAVALVGAIVSSSKAARQAQCCGSQVEAMVQLLVEVAKHTLQLVYLMQSSSSDSGGSNAGLVGGVLGHSGALSGTSADSVAPASAAADGGRPLQQKQQQQQQQGGAGIGRVEGCSALMWAACHHLQSAEAMGKDVELEGCLQQDVKEVKQLLEALEVRGVYSQGSHTASTSSSSSSSTQMGLSTSKGSRKVGTSSEGPSNCSSSTTTTCSDDLRPDQSAGSKPPLADCLEATGRVMASLIQSWCCSNPQCGSLHGPTELGTALAGVCEGCKSVAYCSRGCQELHWPQHRRKCMGRYW